MTISLSLAGAWQQTGAWALLPASLASLICAMILAADLKRETKAPADEPQRIDFDSSIAAGAIEPAGDAVAAGQQQVLVPDEKVAPKSRASRGKGSTRPKKSSASKKASAALPVVDEAVIAPLASEPPAPVEDAVEDVAEALDDAGPLFTEEPQHPPVAPLFEPEPFVRQQRAVFGRKAG
ncbi:MAG: hypothetical protein LOX97_11570 [Sphingomonas sp.]|nr:hypothetical protein [Sphingomonas sp.]